MLRTIKPKNAAAKRALDKREPKLVEDVKTCIFMKTSTSSETSSGALKDLYALKKPDAVMFSKPNQIHPFLDATSLEFLSQKNDCPLFCISSHSKKRPDSLNFIRMFDYQVLDMMEFSIENYIPTEIFECVKAGVGMKPGMMFLGAEFQTDETFKMISNIFIDFFKGEVADSINLKGLETVMVFTLNQQMIHLRVYKISFKKSGTRIPKLELQEHGPFIDFKLQRTHFALDERRKPAMQEKKERKIKNISHDVVGDKMARIHMQSQDLDQLQTRKLKGLRK